MNPRDVLLGVLALFCGMQSMALDTKQERGSVWRQQALVISLPQLTDTREFKQDWLFGYGNLMGIVQFEQRLRGRQAVYGNVNIGRTVQHLESGYKFRWDKGHSIRDSYPNKILDSCDYQQGFSFELGTGICYQRNWGENFFLAGNFGSYTKSYQRGYIQSVGFVLQPAFHIYEKKRRLSFTQRLSLFRSYIRAYEEYSQIMWDPYIRSGWTRMPDGRAWTLNYEPMFSLGFIKHHHQIVRRLSLSLGFAIQLYTDAISTRPEERYHAPYEWVKFRYISQRRLHLGITYSFGVR